MYQQWDQQAVQDPYYGARQNVIFQHGSGQNEEQARQNVFLCPNEGCHRSFSWKNNMMWHVRNSCGLKPRYKCPFCNYKCKVKGDVRKHILRIHKDSEIYVIDLFEESQVT